MGAESSPKHSKALKPSPSSFSPRLTFFLAALSVLALGLLLRRPLERLGLVSRQLLKPPSPPISQLSGPAHKMSSSSSSPPSYAKELRVASLAVQRAALLTQRVFRETSKGTLDKNDKSPVTIGDFGAQALVIAALNHAFPDDQIVGEEEASSLRTNATLSHRVFDLVSTTALSPPPIDAELGGRITSEESMLAAIDRGNSAGGSSGRHWALDPIDGTKGFLRGGQYAVCLALIVDGAVKVGALACPNLPVDDAAPMSASVNDPAAAGPRGVLFAAVAGHGAHSSPLGAGDLEEQPKTIAMRDISDVRQASFCESVESGHSSHKDQAAIAKKLGIERESVRMDSQSKYGSIARGAGDIYLRLPVSATYVEKIWDHAAGDLIVREAGGQVTDISGKRLDFSKGRTLAGNKGVVAARREMHPTVLAAVKEVLGIDG